MPASLESLTTPITVDEATASIYGVLAAVGAKTTTWKKGAVVRTIIAAVALILSSLSELMALIARSGFLELAEGDWLTLVARHVFGVERIDATFAAGFVTLTNTGGGVFNPDAGDIIVKNTVSGQTYRNTDAFSLGALGILTIGITAVEAGARGTSAAGYIDSFETPLINVTVTNAAAVVGLDAETDPELRTRCLEKRSSLSPNGPRDAYAYFAKTATRADGTNVGVSRVRVSASSTTGQVTVTVASPTGAVSGDATDPATDLGAVDFAIKRNVVPDGVTETTQTATALIFNITYELWIYATVNLTDAEIGALVEARLETFFTTQPIGGNVIGTDPGKVFQDAIRTAIGGTRPEIFHVIVSFPGADSFVGPTEVPMLGVVTPTAIHRVAP